LPENQLKSPENTVTLEGKKEIMKLVAVAIKDSF
jgi:hypothetical protein